MSARRVRMHSDRPGWRYAPDQGLGELTYLAGGLHQAVEQIMVTLRHQLEQT